MANYIMQNSGQDLDNAVTAYKNGTIAKSKVGLGNVDNTSDLNKPISTQTQAALNEKAYVCTADGGFEGGSSASAGYGGAIGNQASATEGGAVGDSAHTNRGGAIGKNANSEYGGSVGYGAVSTSGGAMGDNATTTSGGAIGEFSMANAGCAVGAGASTSDGVACGNGANCVTINDGTPIDAIQLGTGTNNTAKTMQVYDKRIVEADGSLTDVGALSGLLTTVKTSVVAAINELHANTGVPAGTVIYYAAATPPAGYLKCDGSAVSRTAYSALFAVIGTTYGAGDGSTTFQLPDLRAEFLRGYDDGRGIDTDRVFGSSQEGTQLYLGSFNATWYGTDGEENADNASSSKISGTSSSTGSSSSIRVRPRNVAMLACIKY